MKIVLACGAEATAIRRYLPTRGSKSGVDLKVVDGAIVPHGGDRDGRAFVAVEVRAHNAELDRFTPIIALGRQREALLVLGAARPPP